jgi:hypothetical protein
MSEVDAAKRQPDAEDAAPSSAPLTWLSKFDRGFTLVKSLSVVTVLSSLLLGYFQYLNSYQEKVGAQAKDDMLAAASAFKDISTKFSQVQALQQLLFSDFATALDDHADADERSLATKNAQGILKTYEEAQMALSETGELMARNAEIYIDWTSSFRRDPAQPRGPTSDPLDQTLLRAYDFDCNEHLPQFEPASGGASKAGRASVSNTCSVDIVQANGDPEYSYVNLCPRNNEKAGSDTSVTIHWFSAKHQVLVMNYCLQNLHERLGPVRSWASQIEAKPLNSASFQVDRDRIQATIDVQAKRLNAFMGLATFRMDAIRETYRPDSFACHVPIVTSVVGLFNDACTPVKTTPIIVARR